MTRFRRIGAARLILIEGFRRLLFGRKIQGLIDLLENFGIQVVGRVFRYFLLRSIFLGWQGRFFAHHFTKLVEQFGAFFLGKFNHVRLTFKYPLEEIRF